MLKKCALVLATGLALAVTCVDAGAMPAASTLAQLQNDATLVREGCGRGWHWSFRWRRCVRNW